MRTAVLAVLMAVSYTHLKYGIAAAWAGIGNALLGSLLAWAVLGRRTRVMTQHLNSATMPQFFAARFQSQRLKLASSAIIFIFLIPYTASLYNGLSRLFGMAFHIDYSVCVIAMAAGSYTHLPAQRWARRRELRRQYPPWKGRPCGRPIRKKFAN